MAKLESNKEKTVEEIETNPDNGDRAWQTTLIFTKQFLQPWLSPN